MLRPLCPLCSALLDGAQHVVLDGVFHRQAGSRLVFGRQPRISKGSWNHCVLCREPPCASIPSLVPPAPSSTQPFRPAPPCSMSCVRTFNEPADVPWYGSEHVVDAWLHHLAA